MYDVYLLAKEDFSGNNSIGAHIGATTSLSDSYSSYMAAQQQVGDDMGDGPRAAQHRRARPHPVPCPFPTMDGKAGQGEESRFHADQLQVLAELVSIKPDTVRSSVETGKSACSLPATQTSLSIHPRVATPVRSPHGAGDF